jgi:hypothetical protein
MRQTVLRFRDASMPTRLRRKHGLILNEPAPKRPGDLIPVLGRTKRAALGTLVKARLTLEADLRACGLSKPTRSQAPTAGIRKVLLAMLTETDSPFSASLRMRAAERLGPMGARIAIPQLRKIAFDEDDDLATRLGALRSYLRLAGDGGATTLRSLFQSRTPQIRTAAYVESMTGDVNRLKTIAEQHFAAERNHRVRLSVRQRVEAIRSQSSTDADAT